MTNTLFTWGYYGWGNHTLELVEAVDAVEASRGFEPPIFVDVRIPTYRTSKRFPEKRFREASGAGPSPLAEVARQQVRSDSDWPNIQIADPSAAYELLDLALARKKQRLLFFCSCPWPRCDGKIACHRNQGDRTGRESGAEAWRVGRDRGMAWRRSDQD